MNVGAPGRERNPGAAVLASAERYLATACLMLEARAECWRIERLGARGDWGAFIAATGLPCRTAIPLVQIAESSVDARTLARVGVRGALGWAGARKATTSAAERRRQYRAGA